MVLDGRAADLSPSTKGHLSITLSPENYVALSDQFSAQRESLPRRIANGSRWGKRAFATICYVMASLSPSTKPTSAPAVLKSRPLGGPRVRGRREFKFMAKRSKDVETVTPDAPYDEEEHATSWVFVMSVVLNFVHAGKEATYKRTPESDSQ